MDEFQRIFEFEIRTKLSRRCQTKNEEIRQLYNSFHFYDFGSSSLIDKKGWIKGIQKIGLCGFNLTDLSDLFDRYDKNKSGYINYRNFTYYIYGKEELMPISRELVQDQLALLYQTQSKRKTRPEIIEFKPPGLYDRSFALMLDNEKRFNKINNNINKIEKKVHDETVNNYINKINKTPLIKRNNNSMENLSIQNYSIFFENEAKYKNLLEKLRTKININNGITYYTFMNELKYYQNDNDKIINLNSCYFILRKLNIGFKFYDLMELFKCIEKYTPDKIKTEKLLSLIRGDLNIKRKTVVKNVFEFNDKEKKGNIKLNEIKQLYNSKMHPDAYVGYKKESDVYKEFCYTFDIFCNFYEIYEYITLEQFIEYYKGISASIIDDNYFDDVLNGVWNINIEKFRAKNDIVNNSVDINKYYNEQYRKELKENEINSNNTYKLNKRYVNNKENNKLIYSHINPRNLFKIEEGKQSYNNNNTLRTPIPKSNIRNFETLQPQRTPYKTPFLTNNINKFRNMNYSASTSKIIMDKEESKQNFYEKNNLYNNYVNNINISTFEKLREIIKSRGQKGIFNLQKLFCLYDKEKSGQISYIKFIELCEIFNINLARKKLKEIFDIFDKEKIGIILYDKLIQALIRNISIDRVMLIKKVYNNFDKDKYGNILINDIRTNFKSFNHPLVEGRQKSEREIYFEFLECLNIFKNYRCNINQQYNIDCLNYGAFAEFFKEISFGIADDELFKGILINCFGVDNSNEE